MSDIEEKDSNLPRITHYTLIRLLGSGNQADVYLARHIHTEDIVAIKLFHRSADWHCIRTVAEIGHPNIVGVRELGRQSGRRYITLEYVEGGSLRDRVKHHGPLNPLEALQFTLGVARALRRLHHVGVLHRDIKPHNLLIDANGNVKLADFGLATTFHNQHVQDSPVGTPAFIPPELWDGQVATKQSDIYSLGATLLFLLTGNEPFSAADLEGYRKAHLTHELVIPRNIPRTIVSLLNCCLHKDPAHRPKNANKLVGMMKQIMRTMTRQSSDALPAITDSVVGKVVTPCVCETGSIDAGTNQLQTDASGAQARLTCLLNRGDNSILFHGCFRQVQDRILRNTCASVPARYRIVVRVKLEGDSLVGALRERLDFGRGGLSQLSEALIKRCEEMTAGPAIRVPVVCFHVTHRFTNIDFAAILFLVPRLSKSNIRLVIICDTASALEIATRLRDGGHRSPSMLELIPPHLNGLPKYIALETDYRTYGEVRWTEDALAYATYLATTTDTPLDLILNNVACLMKATSARLVTTWFVLAASAHKKWLRFPEQIQNKWREPPAAWPSEAFLGTLREVREQSAQQTAKVI